MKRVYHHGALSFCIPKDWIETHEENTGVFYEDSDGAGTLRVTLMVARKHGSDVLAFFKGVQASEGGTLHVLGNGNVLWRNTVQSVVDGQELVEHHWEIGNVVSPTEFRIAMCTFVVLRSYNADARNIRYVAMLEEELRNIQFLAEPDTSLH